jgi:hypothetical protein
VAAAAIVGFDVDAGDLGVQRPVGIRQPLEERRAGRADDAISVAQDHTFHDLRHTCAILLLQDGESITRVSQRLGHSTVKTTLDYYAHCVPQDEDRPARAVRPTSPTSDRLPEAERDTPLKIENPVKTLCGDGAFSKVPRP